MRQQADNSIIQAAQQLRNLYANPPKVKWGKLPLGNHKHIRLHVDFKSMKDRYLDTILGRVYENQPLYRLPIGSATNPTRCCVNRSDSGAVTAG